MVSNYFIKSGYRVREVPIYFDDVATSRADVVWQPDVYPFAAYLARRFRCSYIIDIGCGSAQKLVKLHPEFQVIGVDFKDNVKYCQKEFPFGQWIEWDIDKPGVVSIQSNILSNSVIICSDVIEHVIHPDFLLENLMACLDYAPVALLSTPERELTRGLRDAGPPMNPSHVREWNQSELECLLRSYDFQVEFIGLTRSNDKDWQKWTSLAVLGNNHQPKFCPAPADFRVISFMIASNEEKIILPCLNYLISNGLEVYIMNKDSSDSTGDLARSLLGKGVIGVEDFHCTSSASSSQYECLMDRIAEISNMIKPNWLIHHNANELMESPWPWVTLKNAIYYVDQCGFNCIDHSILNFSLMRDGFRTDSDFNAYYKYKEWGSDTDQSQQINVWKQLDQPVHLTHVDFERSYPFPYKFFIRKYIHSSQNEETKKIRNPLHNSLDAFTRNLPRTHFLQKIQNRGKSPYHSSIFYKIFLIERLSDLNRDIQDFHSEWTGVRGKGIKRLVRRIKAIWMDPYFPLIRQKR